MTVAEYLAELARLLDRKRVTPATPEYLAEIDAKIDKLKAEAPGPLVVIRSESVGLSAILDNLKELSRICKVSAAVNREGAIKFRAFVEQIKGEYQYGFGTIPKLPEPPPGPRD